MSLPFVPDVIVTRHAGAAEWLARNFFQSHDHNARVVYDTAGAPARIKVTPAWDPHAPEGTGPGADHGFSVPVVASATPEQVNGRRVVGNLPMALAYLCERFAAVEFDGPPPRGAEYSADDMDAAGARVVEYAVRRLG